MFLAHRLWASPLEAWSDDQLYLQEQSDAAWLTGHLRNLIKRALRDNAWLLSSSEAVDAEYFERLEVEIAEEGVLLAERLGFSQGYLSPALGRDLGGELTRRVKVLIAHELLYKLAIHNLIEPSTGPVESLTVWQERLEGSQRPSWCCCLCGPRAPNELETLRLVVGRRVRVADAGEVLNALNAAFDKFGFAEGNYGEGLGQELAQEAFSYL